ncbi:MAG: T9SS type A sorting domain-containing protein, partial [Salinivirgaceae bacterium]|nr:T9SS type A sorting domain-containing protein [Salinivirgaceae bacterium]
VSKLGYTTHEGTFDVVDTDVTLNIELTYVDIYQLTNNGFQVYPNPVSKDYRVRVTSVGTMDQLQVFSYNGALLINYSEPTKEYLIDFSKFSKGIYILQARVGEQVHYEKVIVE